MNQGQNPINCCQMLILYLFSFLDLEQSVGFLKPSRLKITGESSRNPDNRNNGWSND